MHEASLAQSALEVVSEAARENGAAKVRRVEVVVGALAQVDPESLRFWMGVLAEGGPAEGAEIAISEVGAEAECASCHRRFPVVGPRWSLACEACGGSGELRSGRELRVQSIEVEETQTQA